MSLASLPDDIIIMLLKHSIQLSGVSLIFSERNLKLLSVCHRWRVLGLPMVYNTAIVKYGDGKVPPECNIRGKDVQDIAEPEGNVIESNLELISFTKSVKYVKTVELTICHLLNPLPGLLYVMSMLSKFGESWDSVDSLKISFFGHSFLLATTSMSVKPFAQNIESARLAITELFPKVSSLKYVNKDKNLILIKLCSLTAGDYSEQLYNFDSEIPIMLAESQRFLQLSSLKIRVTSDVNYKVPQTNASTLEKLEIQTPTNNISWAPFFADNDSNSIVFKNLKYLKLTFHLQDNPEAPVSKPSNYKMVFPRLKHLVVRNEMTNCQFLLDATLPDFINRLDIYAPKAVYERLAQAAILPKMREVNADVLIVTQACIERVCHPINGLLSHLTDLGGAVEICGARASPTLDDLLFKDLNSLRIHMQIDVRLMMGVIRNNPKLRHLEIARLKLGDIPQEMEITDNGSPESPIMISTNDCLKRIKMHFDLQPCDIEHAFSVVKYMLLTFTHLDLLNPIPIPMEIIKEFIETYKPKYPHLENVRFYELYSIDKSHLRRINAGQNS